MFDNRITRHLVGRSMAVLIVALLLVCAWQATAAQSTAAVTYYVAPSGNDSAAGTSTETAWKTFNRAWQTLQPGDTLLVLDGTYNEQINPTRGGQAGNPITIRALNDGGAIIDGQFQSITIEMNVDWYVLDGLVVRNGYGATIRVNSHNNVLRRISAYDASTDINSTVFWLSGNNNLVEDSVAAGTGRYMFEVYEGNNNTLRRVFAKWGSWNGNAFCGVSWPHGYNVGVYNGSNNTVENAIAYGRAVTGIMVQANSDTAVADNNQVLGSMALLSGRDYDGSLWTYGTGQAQPTSRPGPSQCPDNITQWSWGSQRVGFLLYGQGRMQNNVFRDVLATDNMGVGFLSAKPYGIGDSNTTLDHATLYDNGAGAAAWENVQGGNVMLGTSGVQNVTNSRVANTTIAAGEGARFSNRYVNRTLTADTLLPWPMQARIQSELGVSVNALVTSIVQEAGGPFTPVPTAPPGSATPTAPASPTPAATPVPNNNTLRMTVTTSAAAILRNGTVTIKVSVDTPDSTSKPVQISVTDSKPGLNIAPADVTVNTPSEQTFEVTVTSAEKGDVHVLKFIAHSNGLIGTEQSVTLIVDPFPLLLPMVHQNS